MKGVAGGVFTIPQPPCIAAYGFLVMERSFAGKSAFTFFDSSHAVLFVARNAYNAVVLGDVDYSSLPMLDQIGPNLQHLLA